MINGDGGTGRTRLAVATDRVEVGHTGTGQAAWKLVADPMRSSFDWEARWTPHAGIAANWADRRHLDWSQHDVEGLLASVEVQAHAAGGPQMEVAEVAANRLAGVDAEAGPEK